MKQQAAGDRMQRMTAYPEGKLPELFGMYILGRAAGQEVTTYDTMPADERNQQIYTDTSNAMCWWRGEQSHHGGSSMGVSLLPCARTHTHTQQPLAPHTHTNKHNTQHMNDGGFIL